MALASRDYKRLLEIINIVYSIPDRAAMFRAVCEKLQKLIGISSAAFMLVDLEKGNFHFPGHLLFNSQVEPCLLYCLYYAPLNPIVERGLHLKVINEAIRLTDVIPAPRLADTEYGHDFLPLTPHFYELACPLGSQGAVVGGIGFHRKKHERDFSDRDKEIAILLAPHLARAFHTIDSMEAISSAQEVGVILIGANGNPSFMNEEARQALKGRPVGMIPDLGLEAEPVLFRTETGVYHVRTKQTPMSGREKVIFLEPLPTTENLRSKLAGFGLSPCQERVAMLVIRGLSNREIAEQLFIAEQTVKDHLRDVFEKARVHRRTELTAKVLGLQPRII